MLDKGKYYRVDKDTLRAALPRQMPQVDLTRGGDKGMEIAIADMTTLGYIKKVPDGVIDFRLLTRHAEELTAAWKPGRSAEAAGPIAGRATRRPRARRRARPRIRGRL